MHTLKDRIRFKRTCASIFLAASFAACGAQHQASETKLIGGSRDDASLPATVKLEGGSGQVFTGNFIRSDLVMTAAHCLVFETVVRVSIGSLPAIASTDFVIHPDYSRFLPGQIRSATYADIAFVRLPSGSVPGQQLAPLSQQSARVGEKLIVVGYGYDSPERSGMGLRRRGESVVHAMREGDDAIITKRYDYLKGPEDSVTQGDSGGGLYRGNGEIVGIVSNGYFEDGADARHAFGVFVNVLHPRTRSFIETQLSRAAPAPASPERVGGYTCEQQKGWGKCAEAWMHPVCDAICSR